MKIANLKSEDDFYAAIVRNKGPNEPLNTLFSKGAKGRGDYGL